MIKETVTQFVCFATNLGSAQFIPEWEVFVKKMQHKKQDSNLLEIQTETKNKFRFISQHECPARDFQFSFTKEKKSEHFPEHNVRVVQAGGYRPLDNKKRYTQEDDDVKLVAFVSHNEIDIDFYKQLPLFRHLDIYQAYYESCAYGYIMEFYVPEANADELLHQLEQRPGVNAGIYKEAAVPA